MRLAAFLLAVLAVAGCGGGGKPAAATASRPATPETVVRAWAADLRRGDVDAAAARFAVPAIVMNDAPAVRLDTRAEIRRFNAGLTCGGRITRVVPHEGVLLVTFVLTRRPGADCGAGVGGTAQTAFDVRRGHIVRWLRLPDDPGAIVVPDSQPA